MIEVRHDDAEVGHLTLNPEDPYLFRIFPVATEAYGEGEMAGVPGGPEGANGAQPNSRSQTRVRRHSCCGRLVTQQDLGVAGRSKTWRQKDLLEATRSASPEAGRPPQPAEQQRDNSATSLLGCITSAIAPAPAPAHSAAAESDLKAGNGLSAGCDAHRAPSAGGAAGASCAPSPTAGVRFTSRRPSQTGPLLRRAVPLQEVIRHRRNIIQNLGDTGETIAFDSIQVTDAEAEARVAPWSAKQRWNALKTVAKSKDGLEEASAESEKTRSRSSRCSTRRRSDGPSSPSRLSAPITAPTTRRRGTSGQTKRAENVKMWEYVLATILLQHTGKAGAELRRENCFDVVGGVSEVELSLLSGLPVSDRTYVVFTWLLRLIVGRLNDGGLAIPPPLLSRTNQVLSESMAAAQQASKLSHTPFPYPLRQLLALLLIVFQALVPMSIAAFIDCPPLVCIICFFVCLGYMALNETARELEHPFGLGANHLPVVAYQEAFNSKIARLLDLTSPELGYVPPVGSETSGGLGESSDTSCSFGRQGRADDAASPAPSRSPLVARAIALGREGRAAGASAGVPQR